MSSEDEDGRGAPHADDKNEESEPKHKQRPQTEPERTYTGSGNWSPPGKPTAVGAPWDPDGNCRGTFGPLQVPNILQSLFLSESYGKLVLTSERMFCEVFFTHGKVVHCTVNGIEGNNAILEVLKWKGGSFTFYPNESTDKATLTCDLETLLLQGMKAL